MSGAGVAGESRLEPPLPRSLQVEVTGACNLRCAMCLVSYRPALGKTSGSMRLPEFRRLVDSLPELELVTMQGLGEPLLAPDFLPMLELLAERGIRMGFNTNGTLLTQEVAERLVRLGVDWIHVSLDGATAQTYESIRGRSSFELVRRNLNGLVQARRELDAEKPEIRLVFVAMRRNVHELPDLVRIAAEWGVEKLWVQNLSHSFSDTDPAGDYGGIREYAATEALWQEPAGTAEAAFSEARGLADRLGVDLRLPRLGEPGRRRAPGVPGCHWPFEALYVTHDGTVQPCCAVMGSDRATLGRLGRESLAEVWRGQSYRDFRAKLLTDDPPDVCRGCSLLRRVF